MATKDNVMLTAKALDTEHSEDEPDFSFALNSPTFSDRILRLVIEESPVTAKKSHAKHERFAHCLEVSSAECGAPSIPESKTAEEESVTINEDLNVATEQQEKAPLICCKSESTVETVKSPRSVVKALSSDASLCSWEDVSHDTASESRNGGEAEVFKTPDIGSPHSVISSPAPVTLRRIHVSSVILAERSSFFKKLFSNGLRESEEKEVAIHLNWNEEDTMIELLHFMYSRCVNVSSNKQLLKLLLLADRFAVTSCVRRCGELLRGAPMTVEDASACVQLPESVRASEFARVLVEKGKDFLEKVYDDVVQWRKMTNLFQLPVAAMEIVLNNPKLRVSCEREFFEMVLEYVRHQYPALEDLEERKELMAQLGKYVRFSLLNAKDLREAASYPEMQNMACVDYVQEALWFKIAPSKDQYGLEKTALPNNWRYTRRPGVREFCSIYFDISYHDIQSLREIGQFKSSSSSCVQGTWFHLKLERCEGKTEGDPDTLGLFLVLSPSPYLHMTLGADGVLAEYEFLCKFWPSGKYRLLRGNAYDKFVAAGKGWGFKNVFELPWAEVVRDDSPYFRFGAMFLRADVRIKDKEKDA